MNRFLATGCYIFLTALTQAAFATEEKTWLNEIAVTATRTERAVLYSPSSLSLISEEEMAWQVNESLAEVLRNVPGISITDAGQAGMKRIRIRGEDSYRIAILIDGQEITDHRGEGVPLTLDPALVERVEVIKGSGSVLYGPKALGGVINFITRKGGSEPLQLTMATGWDSATQGEQLFGSIYGSSNGFDYRLSLTKDQQGKRRTPKGDVDNTQSESDSAALYVGHRWGNHNLGLSYDDHNAYSQVFVEDNVRFYFPFTEFAMNIPQRDRRKVGLFYDWTDAGDRLKKVHVDAYRQVSDRKFDTYWEQAAFGMEKETFSESRLITQGALLQLDWQPSEDHYLITGIQFTRDEVKQDRNETLFATFLPTPQLTEIFDKAQLETRALFVQDEWHITDRLTLTTGARQYWVESELQESTRPSLATPDKSDNELIISLAATYEVSSGSVLRAAYNEGYIYPSLLQLSIGGGGRNFVNPDPTLQPEKSKNYELGWRYAGNSLLVDITAFYSRSENYIDHVPCTQARCIGGTRRSPSEIYINIGKAQTKGIEAYIEYSLSGSLTPYTALTLIRRENEYRSFSTTDSGLPSIYGIAGIKYDGDFSGWDTGNYWLDAFARGESHADELEEDGTVHSNAGWMTLNLSAGLSFGEDSRYLLSLEMSNLLDNSYSNATENLLAPERALQARFTANFQ